MTPTMLIEWMKMPPEIQKAVIRYFADSDLADSLPNGCYTRWPFMFGIKELHENFMPFDEYTEIIMTWLKPQLPAEVDFVIVHLDM